MQTSFTEQNLVLNNQIQDVGYLNSKSTTHSKHKGQCTVDVLWGQPIKLIQVVSTSEFHEY